MIIVFYCLLVIFSAWGTTIAALQANIWSFSPLVFIFIFTPFLDLVAMKLKISKFFLPKFLDYVWASLPFYTYFIAHFLSLIIIVQSLKSDSFLEILLKTLASFIFNGGQAVVISHELIHSRRRIDKFFANLILASFGYGHFVLEHVQGHHNASSTPEDPTSSRWNETFWSFLPRTVGGQIKSCVRLERSNLKSKNWKIETSFITSLTLTFGMFISAGLLGGINGLIFFIVHSAASIFLLEVGNYVEHYGLVRNKKNGRFEKFNATHSWSSDCPVTNLFLFNLPMHSAHHLRQNLTYLELEHHRESPTLPYGHFIMITIALFPRLWFKLVNPILINKFNSK